MNTLAVAVPEEHVGVPLWLITFADLTGILVSLFVLLFSMSGSVSEAGKGFLIGAETGTAETPANGAAARLSEETVDLADLTLGYLSAVLSDRGISTERSLANGTLEESHPVVHHIEGERLIVSLDPSFLFASGQMAMKPSAMDFVSSFSDVLSYVANPVSVIAPVPAGDWTLAFDRAGALVEALHDKGYRASVERFVNPGIPDTAIILVVGRSEGARSR